MFAVVHKPSEEIYGLFPNEVIARFNAKIAKELPDMRIKKVKVTIEEGEE